MNNEIRIDIVSDVSCPWCVIGYRSLQSALEEAGVAPQTSLNWLPFELNPDMPKQGQQHGIRAVPAVIFNDKYLVSGGQPKDVFIDVIQKLSTQ